MTVKIQGIFLHTKIKRETLISFFACSFSVLLTVVNPFSGSILQNWKKAKATADEAPKIRVSNGHFWRKWQVHRRALHAYLDNIYIFQPHLASHIYKYIIDNNLRKAIINVVVNVCAVCG